MKKIENTKEKEFRECYIIDEKRAVCVTQNDDFQRGGIIFISNDRVKPVRSISELENKLIKEYGVPHKKAKEIIPWVSKRLRDTEEGIFANSGVEKDKLQKIKNDSRLQKLIEKMEDTKTKFGKMECEIVGEFGQTDFIPIESTKIVCRAKIYP